MMSFPCHCLVSMCSFQTSVMRFSFRFIYVFYRDHFRSHWGESESIDIDGLLTRTNWFRSALEYPAMWKKGYANSNARDQVEGNLI